MPAYNKDILMCKRNTKITTNNINLQNEVCPMTFVKTRLELDKLKKGEILKVFYGNKEAKINVPVSLKELGHDILEIKNIDKNIFYILIKK